MQLKNPLFCTSKNIRIYPYQPETLSPIELYAIIYQGITRSRAEVTVKRLPQRRLRLRKIFAHPVDAEEALEQTQTLIHHTGIYQESPYYADATLIPLTGASRKPQYLTVAGDMIFRMKSVEEYMTDRKSIVQNAQKLRQVK